MDSHLNLTLEYASEFGFTVSKDAFEDAMKKQKRTC